MTAPDSFDSPDGRTYSGPALPPLPPKWTGKYRKRPVVVEAVQLVDDLRNHTEVAAWIEGNGGHAEIPFAEPCLFIETLEGTMRADIGWWVVRGVAGEFYAVRPDIFEATHEPAGATAGDGIQVTVTDLGSGDTETVVISDDYVITCAGTAYVDGVQAYANGTHVITVKGRKHGISVGGAL